MQETSGAGALKHENRGEILRTFLKLGLTSFGGPIAHLGYFHDELFTRRKWISERGYADLVALCQFLPGPASSKVGFALGLSRGGIFGALIAWAAFTLPSVLLLLVFAYSVSAFGRPVGQGIIHGLKLVAVAVIAQAVLSMARNLCPDRERSAIATGAVLIVVFLPGALGQVGAIIFGAIGGLWLCKNLPITGVGCLCIPLSRPLALLALLSFFILLLILPLIATVSSSQLLHCSKRSIRRVPWHLGAAMWSCPCWKQAWSKLAGSARAVFWQDTVPPRLCQGLCLPLLHISAQSSRPSPTESWEQSYA